MYGHTGHAVGVIYSMKSHLKHLKGQTYVQDTGQIISNYKLLHVNNLCVCVYSAYSEYTGLNELKYSPFAGGKCLH